MHGLGVDGRPAGPLGPPDPEVKRQKARRGHVFVDLLLFEQKPDSCSGRLNRVCPSS